MAKECFMSGKRKPLCERILAHAQQDVDSFVAFRRECEQEIQRRRSELEKKWGKENVRELLRLSGDQNGTAQRKGRKRAYARTSYQHPGNPHERHYHFSEFKERVRTTARHSFRRRREFTTEDMREKLGITPDSPENSWVSLSLSRLPEFEKRGTRYLKHKGKRVSVFRWARRSTFRR